MNRPELDYFISAQEFFKSDLNKKIGIYKSFNENQNLTFVYDQFLEKKLKKSAYVFCNFNFLMYCVYYTYSNVALDFVFGDDASIEKIENSKNYLNQEILTIAKEMMDDVALRGYYATEFQVDFFNINFIADPQPGIIFDVDKVVSFYDFLPRQFDC